MKFILQLLCITFILPTATYAQKISITLPNEANKKYALVLNKGLVQDTIKTGTFSFTGGTMIELPEEHKDYVGMAALRIQEGNTVNFVVNHESFSMTSEGGKGFRFRNSKENEYLYSGIQNTEGKIDTTLYAYQFIKLISYMRELEKYRNGQLDIAQRVEVKRFALKELDVDALYTSGLWYYVVDGIIHLSPDQEEMGNNIVRVLERVKSDVIYEYLVDNLITITGQFGWDDAFDIIIPHVQSTNRIEHPAGQIYVAFAMAKVRKGLVAPAIEGLKETKESQGNTLLIFYQPGCDNCEVQLTELAKEYEALQAKAVRIVSISSDHDKARFEQDCQRLPWVDKLCDFKGFTGPNFANYGIMATPTIFYLDKDLKVIGRYALLKNVIF